MLLRSGKRCASKPPQIAEESLNLDTETLADDENGGHENTAEMSPALLNPIVLHSIFSYLTVPDLKTVRLVCNPWRSVGSTLLGKSTILTASKLFHFSDNKLSAHLVDPKLTRQVYASSEIRSFDDSIPIRQWTRVVAKSISTTISPLTENLTIGIDQKSYVTPVLQGAKKLKKSNVKEVYFIVIMGDEWGEKAPALAYKKLPVLASLTSLTFNVCLVFGFAPFFPNLALQPVLQGWIDAAPNLTSLSVLVGFYPNLEGCKSLKVFKFRYDLHFSKGRVDMGAVTGMLEQIKDSVEHVELDSDMSGGMCIGQLDLPVMPHVVTFYADDTYQILDHLDEHRLPKLKHLKLMEFWHDERKSVSTALWKGHRGVESVTLTMILSCDCDHFSETLVKLFPFVKTFDLTWKLYNEVDSDHVNGVMEPFKFWNLDVATVSLKAVKHAGNMVAAMRRVSTWTGVKTAQFSTSLEKGDFTTDVIKDIIGFSADFKTVEIEMCSKFRQEDEFMDGLRSMITTKRAPIRLKIA